MKKKKYDWPKRCLSLMCVLVLVSMIILQSVPVTYASDNEEAWQNTGQDAFTSEPEENEAPPEEGTEIGNQLVDGIFSDGGAENPVENPTEEASDNNSENSNQGNPDISQTPSSGSEQEISSENPDGKQSDLEANANPQEENEDIWKISISSADLTGDYAKDITAIARTQLGVQENRDNFITAEDGIVHNYSRYGQWEGDPYEEWSAAFVNFCAHYANIPQQYLPKSEKVSQWAEILNSTYGLVKDDYSPKEGDLVFFQTNIHADGNIQIQTETPAHTGIVTSADTQYVYTIEGNCGGEVRSQQYPLDDSQIYGYLNMDKVKKAAGLLPEELEPANEVTQIPEEPQPTEELTPTPEVTEAPSDSAMQYEDEDVIITVEAEPGVIPEGSTLSVTPIVSDENDADKQAQYEAVADKLTEKAEKEDYDLAGFLAYDISFIDADGNETEPSDNVKVSINYKKAQAPENIVTDENTELKVMHLEENSEGEVQQVTDLSDEDMENDSTEAIIEADDDQNVEKVEFSADSFSTFAITWVSSGRIYFNITVHYVDEAKNEITGSQNSNVSITGGETIKFSDYAEKISGYKYIGARIDDGEQGTYADSLTAQRSGRIRKCIFKWGSMKVKELSSSSNDTSTKTIDVYLIYSSTSHTSTKATLSHDKYIKKNAANNTYDITLNVAGTVGSEISKKKLDIVLLMDISGSMKGSKLSDAKSAVRSLTDKLNDRLDKIDVNYKLVTFSNSADIRTSDWVSGPDLYARVTGLSADGGTNYDDGLSKAATAVSTGARVDADKIVIFLTDGEPTYYNTKNGYDGPGSCANEATYKAAITSAGQIVCDRFMAIGLGLGNVDWEDDESFEGRPSTGQELLQNVTDATNATVQDSAIDLEKSEELPQKFKDIAEDILTFYCKNVTITDTLSQYVDVTDTSKIELKIAKRTDSAYAQQGDTVQINLTDENLLSENGKSVTVNGEVLGTVHYNAQNKQITWSLGEDYQLKKDLYYYLTITNVQPNRTAETSYLNNGGNYGNSIGDANTDASEDGFYGISGENSSGKPGFPSNNTATVTYTETKTNQTDTQNYADPVVQVDQNKLEKQVTFSKVWKDGSNYKETRKDIIELKVQYQPETAGTEESWQDYTGKYNIGENEYSNENFFMSASNVDSEHSDTWKVTITKLPAYLTAGDTSVLVRYRVTEVNVPEGYTMEQTSDSEVTNTLNWKIIKQDSETKQGLSGAEFELRDSSNTLIATGVSQQESDNTALGEITWTFSNSKITKFSELSNEEIYTLTETKAPSGYVIHSNAWKLKFQDGVLRNVDNGASIEKNDSSNEVICYIGNARVYELPNSGGSGIYMFAISGAALMTTALLLLINNKWKEDKARVSSN